MRVFRPAGTNAEGKEAGEWTEAGRGGGSQIGDREAGSTTCKGGTGPSSPESAEGSRTAGENPTLSLKKCFAFIIFPPLTILPIHLFQASELAEHTARIALLEEAKKRKEEEAMTWQHRVRHKSYTHPTVRLVCLMYSTRQAHIGGSVGAFGTNPREWELWLDFQFNEWVSAWELKRKWWKQALKWRRNRQKAV